MKKIKSIIQGLYGISESEKMMPKESSRYTLNKTIECLEIALEQYDTKLQTDLKTLTEKQNKIKEILKYREIAFDSNEFGATYSDLDNIIEQISDVINS